MITTEALTPRHILTVMDEGRVSAEIARLAAGPRPFGVRKRREYDQARTQCASAWNLRELDVAPDAEPTTERLTQAHITAADLALEINRITGVLVFSEAKAVPGPSGAVSVVLDIEAAGAERLLAFLREHAKAVR